MSKNNYNPKAVFEARRKKRQRKIRIRRFILGFFTLIITTTLVCTGLFVYRLIKGENYDNGFIPWVYGSNVSKKVKKAEELKLPDWVDSQIIHKHSTARTGFRLNDIKNVVIHYIGNPNTTAQNNRDYFDRTTTGVSSHFIVGLEGEVIQCVPIYERSAASNNRNKDTISIEICHPDDSGEFTETTYESAVKLTAWLCYEFDLKPKDVIRHYDITGKICPKYYVENEDEWEKFISDVKEKLDEY